MAKVYLTPIDLQNNELLNAVLHNVPGSLGTTGQPGGKIHYRSDNGYIEWFNAVTNEWMTPGTGEVSEHEGKADPHAQYLTQTEADALYEDDGAVASHEGAADPHSQYQMQAESDARYVNETDFTKAAVDALNVDADTVDAQHAADLLARANHTGTQSLSTITGHSKAAHDSLGIDADTVDGEHAAALLDRSNHTGTQPHTTISDFDDGVRASRLDQMAVPTGSVDLNSQRITNLSDPLSSWDGANKKYVDNAIQGINAKDSVRVATTGNIDIATAPSSVDGVTLSPPDRILVKDQTDPRENGIYYFIGSGGELGRSMDADAGEDLESAFVFVEEGTVNSDSGWLQTEDDIVIGTDDVSWVRFSGAGQIEAGNGLTKIGNTLDVGAGSGITVNADTVDVDEEWVADFVGAMFSGNTEIGITVTYQDGDNTIDFTVAYGTVTDLDGTSSNGSGSTAARANHKHGLPYQLGSPTTVNANSAAAAGNDTLIARADHVHGLSVGSPEPLAPSSIGAEGTSPAVARQDHVHQMDGFAIDGHIHNAAHVQTIGDGSATSIAVTHNLGTTDVIVQIQDLSQNPDAVAEADYQITDANTVTFVFSSAPTVGSIKVIIFSAHEYDPEVIRQTRFSAFKTSSETISNSDTLQEDDELSLVPGEGIYAVEAYLLWGATGMSVPSARLSLDLSSIGGEWALTSIDSRKTAANDGFYPPSMDADLGSDSDFWTLIIRGYVRLIEPASVTLLWAQSSPEASGLTLRFGSWLRAERIA